MSSELPPASSARALPAGARICAGRGHATAPAAHRSNRGEPIPRRAAVRVRPRTGRCSASRRQAEWRCQPGQRPAEPDAREKGLRRRARLHDDVRREAPEARERLVGEGELTVRHVLDDQEPVVLRQLDELRSPLGDKAHAGRVLVVGDAVDELRAEPTCEAPLQVFRVEPVLVHSDGDERRLEASERLDRAEYVGPSTRGSRGRGRTWRPARGSMAPLVISSSSSAGQRPCRVSSRPARASSNPARPRVGCTETQMHHPRPQASSNLSRGDKRSGNPPADNELRYSEEGQERNVADLQPRARGEPGRPHITTSGVVVTLPILRRGYSASSPTADRFRLPPPQRTEGGGGSSSCTCTGSKTSSSTPSIARSG